jgi:hypothetical protein
MLGIAMSQGQAPQRWWPDNARYAVDFITRSGMRDGVHCPLPELISLSRPSPKLAMDRTGRWHSFAPDMPALTDRGLSLEPAATNLVVDNTGETAATLTGVVASAWTLGDCPLEGGSARRLTQGSGASDGFSRRVSLTGGAVYTASRFYKYDGSTTWVRMSVSDNVANVYFCYVNLATMGLGSSGISGAASLQGVTLTQSWNTGAGCP